MIKSSFLAILTVLLIGGGVSASWSADLDEGCVAAERLQGSDDEAARMPGCQHSRTVGVNGVVSGPFAASMLETRVPPGAVLEALQAFAAALDVESDLRDGDHFYIRYEQPVTVEGQPIGIGRMLWAELQTAVKGVVAVHRFRPAKTNTDLFWLATGEATTAPVLRMPLKSISVTSGFGLRADPMHQPSTRTIPMGPVGSAPSMSTRVLGGAMPRALSGNTVNVATARGLALGLAPGAWRPTMPASSTFRVWAMHEGVDLVAPVGTPILAAGDGIVRGAEPRGRYGNWIEIDQDGTYGGDKLATVYGHLSAFAPGITAGVRVSQGDVIGFTGNTGRTTGPHLHFEILANGRPANPIDHLATRRTQLSGSDLERFKGQVARDRLDREHDRKAAQIRDEWGYLDE